MLLQINHRRQCTRLYTKRIGESAGGSTGWADCSTIIPWNMYLAYGDKKILADQYNSMKAWVDFMKNKSVNDLWKYRFSILATWLFYHPDDDNDGGQPLQINI
jgi:alpha-L-rhamnosidase